MLVRENKKAIKHKYFHLLTKYKLDCSIRMNTYKLTPYNNIFVGNDIYASYVENPVEKISTQRSNYLTFF